ncbi:MAG: serine acetyltransferase [Deltaproteobacteria bacterium]|nr:serine acetyltransferase [Deltaproteobacteria bacterium]MBW2405394.1 serine acetyltransferase [Deltaproteobacteria bacterium]MBW2547298.1 serine acetyltransferase [Deltaproteobacteria bacterium]
MSGREPKRHQDLEDVIDVIAGSYDNAAEINNLDSAALPNKRAVITAFNHVMSVLYMGFYSTRALNRTNLRYALSEHLYPAQDILVEQIERAVRYQERMGRLSDTKPDGWSEDVVLRLLERIPELRRLLNADVRAAYDGDPAAMSIEEVIFSYPSVQAISAYRVAHELCLADVPMIPRIITEYAHSRSGIDINPCASIGESFFIDHGTGVVIGATAVIGSNVKLYQGVTLGALSVAWDQARGCHGTKRHPTIEDDVTIYAGASIHGGDTVIGKGSVIGGNVWLTKSVPPGSKVFGRAK